MLVLLLYCTLNEVLELFFSTEWCNAQANLVCAIDIMDQAVPELVSRLSRVLPPNERVCCFI